MCDLWAEKRVFLPGKIDKRTESAKGETGQSVSPSSCLPCL